jgi:hypothetical protein
MRTLKKSINHPILYFKPADRDLLNLISRTLKLNMPVIKLNKWMIKKEEGDLQSTI